MIQEPDLGKELRSLNYLIERRLNAMLSMNGVGDITPMHGMILGYLNMQEGHEVYQKDIETEFGITRSTVTSILKLMEQKGYIKREAVAHDARLKRLVSTPQGVEAFHRVNSSIRQIEETLRSALSPEECRMLFRLFAQLKSVL